MKTYKKITNGFVIQDFIQLSDGSMVCKNQEFIAGDPVDYEDNEGNSIIPDTSKEIYCPFEMVQNKHFPFPEK